MQHYLTYYKLIELIKNNLPIKMKSFGHGDIVYFGERNENTLYPLMFVTPLQFTYDENTTQANLSIIFGDIVNTDLSNQVDVVSDMSLAARDFMSQISNKGGTFYDYFDVVVPVISNTFVERFNDHIGGVALDINIVYFEDINACDQYVSPTPTPSTTPTPTPSLTPTPTPSLPTSCGIIVGGGFTDLNGNTRNRLVKLSDNGVDLASFYSNLGTGFSSNVRSTLIQSDGKIVVGGDFTGFNGNTRNRLIRLNSDGTEDTAFYTNLGAAFNNQIHSIAVQSDDKILVGGQFTTLNGITRNRLVRLNSDGTEDTAFYTNLGSAFSSEIRSVRVQSDGKILVGGVFTTFDGNTRNRLVRLNSDGTEDTAFYTNLGTAIANNVVNDIVVQSDDKILVGGNFTAFDGNTRNRLIRLNSDGTEDTAFYTNLGTGFNDSIQTNSISVQSDGKIVVGGAFTTFDGNTRNNLVRLNTDGTEDTAFYTNLGTGFTESVLSIVEDVQIQSDDKILVGGRFTELDGNIRNRLVRLNSDGTEDTSFYTNLGTGFSSSVLTISLYCPLPPPSPSVTPTRTPTPTMTITPTPSLSFCPIGYNNCEQTRFINISNPPVPANIKGNQCNGFFINVTLNPGTALISCVRPDSLIYNPSQISPQFLEVCGTYCPPPSPTPSLTPSITPSITPTPSCSVTTQYLQAIVLNANDARFSLWDDSGYTISAQAICEITISFSITGSSSTVVSGITTLMNINDHNHIVNINSFIPGEDLIAVDIMTALVPLECLCYNVIHT